MKRFPSRGPTPKVETAGPSRRSRPGPTPTASGILKRLTLLGSSDNIDGMARFGIRSSKSLGVPMPELRAIARQVGSSHQLALDLWSTGVLEARMLAAMVDDPREVTADQMERWVAEFDNWALCDGCCADLFRHTHRAYEKAEDWTRREPEFVKRAGFALVARLAFHDRTTPNHWFLGFLRTIEREANDDRRYVKKGVNWALREIGKRNPVLHRAAIRTALRLRHRPARSARWIASDALRELESQRVLLRMGSTLGRALSSTAKPRDQGSTRWAERRT